MFSGIVENIGVVKNIQQENSNIHCTITCPFANELAIDQSVAHDGVCLTVIKIFESDYVVTAIAETLQKTNLHNWVKGESVNLERCLKVGDRLDGHIVQGHVDTTAICTTIENENGSWKFGFEHEKSDAFLTIAKGSICINGVSLTVVDSAENQFSVCVIPYTFEHTTFGRLKLGSQVNLEFDVIGKYVQKLMSTRS